VEQLELYTASRPGDRGFHIIEPTWDPGRSRAHRVVLEAWRIEFNTEHPHSSLGYLTPAQFAASWGAA